MRPASTQARILHLGIRNTPDIALDRTRAEGRKSRTTSDLATLGRLLEFGAGSSSPHLLVAAVRFRRSYSRPNPSVRSPLEKAAGSPPRISQCRRAGCAPVSRSRRCRPDPRPKGAKGSIRSRRAGCARRAATSLCQAAGYWREAPRRAGSEHGPRLAQSLRKKQGTGNLRCQRGRSARRAGRRFAHSIAPEGERSGALAMSKPRRFSA